MEVAYYPPIYTETKVYTLTLGDGKTPAQLLAKLEKYLYVGHEEIKFILSPDFRMQKGPLQVEMELFNIPEWVKGENVLSRVPSELAHRKLEMPTEEDAIRFGIAYRDKYSRNEDCLPFTAFPHLDNLMKAGANDRKLFFLSLVPIGRTSPRLDAYPADHDLTRVAWIAGRRAGTKRPVARDYLRV